MKKYLPYIWAILAVVALGSFLWMISGDKKNAGQTADEFYFFNNQLANKASMSVDVTNNNIIVEGDPGSTYASLAVGASLRFNTASSFDDSILSEKTDYFVVSASDDRFQVSLTRGGTAIDFGAAASSGGGEWFTENILSAVANLDGAMDATITIDGEEVPSASTNLVTSIAKNQPDFFASQSRGNRYEYVDMYAVEDDTELEGDTGITFTGTDVHASYYLNPQVRTWTAMWLKDLASGSFTATIKWQPY
jgi:hypothetical protein